MNTNLMNLHKSAKKHVHTYVQNVQFRNKNEKMIQLTNNDLQKCIEIRK